MRAFLMLLMMPFPAIAETITFGSEQHVFDIEFVEIGNPGNAPEREKTGRPGVVGGVPYVFQIGKYEVSRQAIVAADEASEFDGTGGSIQSASPFLPSEFGLSDSPDKPAIQMSWNRTLRFVNWLNTSSGLPPAYKFGTQPGSDDYDSNESPLKWQPEDEGYDEANPMRNRNASFVLPTMDEWYKAAYHKASDGVAGGFYNYPTGSNTRPSSTDSGTDGDAAVFGRDLLDGPADVTAVGTPSAYGTLGQGGNVWEHVEQLLREPTCNPICDNPGVAIRGGGWDNGVHTLATDFVTGESVKGAIIPLGFRVARVFPQAGLVGDFDGDGLLSATDIDLLTAQVLVASDDLSFDLNADGQLDSLDREVWVEGIANTNFGDADLNGLVSFLDFVTFANNFDQPSGWAGGDFDGNGMADFQDFLLLANNFGATSASDVAAVPEPSSSLLALLLLIVPALLSRKSRAA